MSKAVQFGAIIDGVTKKKDGTLTIKLGTQELSPTDTAEIFELGNRAVWAALAETELSPEDLDIPEIVPEFRNDKTPSQRLRSTLYVYWKEHSGSNQDFDTYWKKYVDRLVETLKDKMN